MEFSEKNNKENYLKTTLEEGLIVRHYMPAEWGTEKSVFLTATDITIRLEEFTKKVNLRNVGISLKKLGFERFFHTLNGTAIRGYFVIPLN